ncbi:gamma-type small acid-soluble spore protein [Aquibacillus koreensis]|uniref:Gamma-type small acid-soluble spore protein n=1 Tax=Aquibacillus koreensis TaxID=279446 RepID=A0A9X3WLJ5_9BACI|nr:gamma-type small acid-soluble spore protein [Aquibacillus koreensis]MCT2538228.1 gamma-type small acid-soluble spore protein [Aquibacillus koreensis]MDC3420828.1 gamma-type small acid-soluble spore protein [Aquibacillus koreensis]
MKSNSNNPNNASREMSYNEAKAYIARTTGGHNTRQYSTTDIEKVRNALKNQS